MHSTPEIVWHLETRLWYQNLLTDVWDRSRNDVSQAADWPSRYILTFFAADIGRPGAKGLRTPKSECKKYW
jgi:hypothetical protein